MADHKIKISGVADFSSLNKKIKELNSTIGSTFDKKGVKLFDESSLSFIKDEVNTSLSEMKDYLTSLRREASSLNKEMKEGVIDSKKQEELTRKRLEITRNILQAEKSIRGLQKSQAIVQRGTTGGEEGGGGGLVSSVLSNPAIAGTIAALTAVIGVSVSRAAKGFGVYQQAVPDILKLSGKGMTPLKGGVGQQLGFNVLEDLQNQLSLGSAFGKAKPGEERNRLLNTLTSARALGVEPGEIAGAGEQLRAVGGTEQASKQMAEILSGAMQKGMDKSQASHYLAAATDLLTDLNKNGASNTDKMIGLFSDLTAKGKTSPEQIAKTFSNINSAIKESEGETNSFFQNAAARMGLGRGTILGTQYAVRQGLTGVNTQALQKEIGDTEAGRTALGVIRNMGLDKGDFTQKFARGILQETSRGVNMTTQEGKAQALSMVGERFGAKDIATQARIYYLLDRIANGPSTQKDKQELKELTQDPQETWRQKTLASLDKIALQTAATQANALNRQFELGEASAGIFNALTNSVAALDSTLKQVLANNNGEIESITGMISEDAQQGFGLGKGISDFAAGAPKLLDSDTWKDIGSGISDFFSGKPNAVNDAQKSVGGDRPGSMGGDVPGKTGFVMPNLDGQDNHPMVQEQKKTNQLLEKLTRSPVTAPRAGREPNRP